MKRRSFIKWLATLAVAPMQVLRTQPKDLVCNVVITEVELAAGRLYDPAQVVVTINGQVMEGYSSEERSDAIPNR